MKFTTAPMWLRMSGAFAGACVVVLTLSIISASLIRLWDKRDEPIDGVIAHPVASMVGYSSVDLAELLGEPRYALPQQKPLPALPPVVQRARTGFVMLNVTVDASGRALSAEVIEATPSGIYEQQAISEALAQSYPAGAAGEQDTVVRFVVPQQADAP